MAMEMRNPPRGELEDAYINVDEYRISDDISTCIDATDADDSGIPADADSECTPSTLLYSVRVVKRITDQVSPTGLVGTDTGR